MPRLFTALEIPRNAAMSLSLLRGGLPGARWIDVENYHITLRFIGDLPGRLAEAGVPPELAEGVVQVAREGSRTDGAVPPPVTEAVRAAFTTGVQSGMWVIAAVSFGGSLLIVLFLILGRKAPVSTARS